MKKLIFTILISFYVSILFAQTKGGKSHKTLPKDLDKEILIFLRHDSIDFPDKRPKGMTSLEYSRIGNHNKFIPESNRQLRETAKKYPFKYIIASASQLDSLSAANYKYVFFSPAFNKLKSGERTGSKLRTKVGPSGTTSTLTIKSTNLEIINLQNNDVHFVDDFSETFVYYYKGLVNTLNKKVKKQYNL